MGDGAQVGGPCYDLGSHANLINSSTSRQTGLISGNLKRGHCDPHLSVRARHSTEAHTHTHTNRLTHRHSHAQKHTNISGTVKAIKIFLQMSSPWHGEGLCLHANQTHPPSPQIVSLLSIHYFKHPMTTSFNLKERGILKTISDPPPTSGILNHPPNNPPPPAPQATSLFSQPLLCQFSILGEEGIDWYCP